MNKILSVLITIAFFIFQNPAIAVDVAPRISDREIIERLTRLEEGQLRLEEGQKRLGDDMKTLDKTLNRRIDDLRAEMNSRFVEVNHRFEEVDNRFDTLQWMLGLFITIALVIFGFILRMQWQMHRRQTQMETLLATQRDELSFIKSLIEKFFPPKGVL